MANTNLKPLGGKTLGVDMDGVIADWVGGILFHLEQLGHKPPQREELTSYQFQNDLPDGQKQAMSQIANTQGFFADLDPIPWAMELLRTLDAMGLHIVFVTSPYLSNPHCYPEKVAWITKHLGYKFRDRVVLTLDKTLVDVDVLVDDKPDIIGHGPSRWVRVVYDQPYNQMVQAPRMHSWHRDYGVLLDALQGGNRAR